MKKLICLVLGVLSLSVFSPEARALKREHRATWMSAYVKDWPSGAITESSAELLKKYAEQYVDSLHRNNFTTIYYHARAMCDAMYDSKYEPWSSYVSTARGVKPAFDPLGVLLENAHSRGLEVYAWLNPYRYLDSTLQESWGSDGGELNYENSHPDWLIKYKFTNKEGALETWTILNPALPEVKQRIVDIVADILSKYDVDGIVFDDYFYQNSLPTSYDSTNYQEYVEETTAKGETPMSQMDWRRENVNDMVRMVNAYIKETKPWVRFGIGPAGVAASSASVAEKYGVSPCPGSDWQYNGIASDPLAWLSEGSIDFISPQVYWKIGNAAADYAKIAPWWYEVAAKFNRHCFISQDLSNTAGSTSPLTEFYDQISITHTAVENDAPGTVYFPWKSLRDKRQRIDNKWVYLMPYLRGSLFSTPSLTPAVTWVNTSNPGQLSNVKRSGRTLTWDGPENVRFTVYAVPADVEISAFFKDAEYLKGVSYEKSFEIPQPETEYPGYGIADADLDKYRYAVAVYDRYGTEYGAIFEGAEIGTSEIPELVYPADGTEAPHQFRFSWKGSAPVYEIRVATDSEMKDIVARQELSGTFVDAADLCRFEPETTYYWTVTARETNAAESVSPVESFKVDVFRILSPLAGATEVALAPELRCVALDGATSYRFLIGEDYSFSKTVFEQESSVPSVTVPKYQLLGNTGYYVKAEAVVAGETEQTSVSTFTTKNAEVTVPVFETPSADGETLHSNWRICVAPQEGVDIAKIMVSASETFPPRSSYTGSFSGGVFYTPHLEEIKMVSKYLENGKTYFTRAQFNYVNAEGKTVSTDWTTPVSFVYDSEAGVESVTDDGIYLVGGDDAALVAREVGLAVTVYSTDGKKVLVAETGADGRASLSMLPEGIYLVTVETGGAVRTFRLAR